MKRGGYEHASDKTKKSRKKANQKIQVSHAEERVLSNLDAHFRRTVFGSEALNRDAAGRRPIEGKKDPRHAYREECRLRMLHQRYMGVNPFPLIKSYVLRGGD